MCEGKASFVDLTARLQEDDGLPVTGLKADVVYAARRAVEAQHNLVYLAWATAFKRWDVYVDPCYKLYPEEVRQIKMETVNAPTMEVGTKIRRNTVQKTQIVPIITVGASSNAERRVYEPH